MFHIFRTPKLTRQLERRTARQRKAQPAKSRHRRLTAEALEARTLLSVNSSLPVSLGDLPVPSQHAISAAIGNDESAYQAVSNASGVSLANPNNGFTANLQSGALAVATGADTWNMSLVGMSFGAAAQSVGTAETLVNGNRVDNNYSSVDEWYVNGPAGLEQGFNVPALTPAEATGTLTLQLTLGGSLTASVDATGDGLVLSRADGSTALYYSGLAAYDATGAQLPASLQLENSGGSQVLLINVNDTGAQGQITIDPFVQNAKLTASDGTTSDNFGESVAINGNTAVVGVPNANAAYVFVSPVSGWTTATQTAKLSASDGTAGIEFGYSVAISGNTIAVSSPNATGSISGRPGAVYVFTEPTTGWANMTQTAKLTPSDGAKGPWFGQSVAIGGGTILVGATGTAAAGFNNTGLGAAYLFTEPSSGWANGNQTAILTSSDGVAADQFGHSVALSGGTAVVGALEATIGTNAGQGAAYVFTEPTTGWATTNAQTAKLTATDGTASSFFGYSVSVSGPVIAVGAWGANNDKGEAYEFTEPSNGWATGTQTAILTASDGAAGDDFGFSVSTSDSVIVASSPNATVSGNADQGAAYEFTEPTTGWATMTQTTKLTASDGTANNNYGSSVSISGVTALIGADNAGGGQGAAYVQQSNSPYVTGVTPSLGPTSGGQAVTITGTGFTGATVVDFGTAAATSVVVVSATEITAKTPAGTAGTVDVTVTTSVSKSVTNPLDQYTYVPAPTVTVVSPNAGPTAGGATVTITGTNFTGATLVDFGTTAATNLVVVSATEITVTDPAENAGVVNVIVTTPGGTSATSTADQFTYDALPIITGVNPASGPLAGGTSVTISGSNLAGATAVDFGANPATITGITANSISVTDPAGAAGTVNVSVTTPGGTSVISTSDQFTYANLPTVTSVIPIVGPISGGTAVTITGTNFTGASAVDFGTLPGTLLVVQSATEITAVSPAEAAGAVDVTVVAPGGTSATSMADQFTYLAAPVVTAITPTIGPLAGGTSVIITGTNFSYATAVDFGSNPATGVVVNSSGTEITVESPAASSAGTVNVTVTTPGGTSSVSPADQFTYVLAPTVTSISPTQGPLSGGTTVTINGTGFTGSPNVYFGTVQASNVTVVSATKITCTDPPEAAGTVNVTVTDPGGTSATSTNDQFTYTTAPIVTGLSPSQGPIQGGTTVTLTGSNFTGATVVDFGTTAATNVMIVSATEITCVDPAEAAGTVTVSVTTLGGVSGAASGNQFLYLAVPAVTGVSPTAGPLAGGTTVTISGSGFTGATAVDFGTLAATSFTINSDKQIAAVDPAQGVSTVDVTVIGPSGTSTTSPADQFSYVLAPTVTAVNPIAGPLVGGTTVVITGTGFTGTPTVDFGSTPAASYTVNSPTQITAVSPAEAVGTVDVTVTGPGGTSATSTADQFTYVVAPTVTGVSPAQGAIQGGATITITGTNFTMSPAAPTVLFGTTNGTNVVVVSATQITVTDPAESAGTVNVTVKTAGGTSATSAADQFLYLAVPVVTGVSPAAGPLAGGTTVTIAGTGFTGSTVVDFGLTAGTNLVVVSATEITVSDPVGAPGAVDVTVTNPSGTSATSPADQFTYEAAPTVTGVSPALGPFAGGLTVTITGTNFTATPVAPIVDFGTTAATNVVVVSATSITATEPAGTAGTVDVTVVQPGGTSATSSADQFTYVPAPMVTSVSPVGGPLAGGTTVIITGTGFAAGTPTVDFGTMAATTVTVNSATQITAVNPAESAGLVNVTVIGPGGTSATSSADQFTYLTTPTVAGVLPTVGPAPGGATVTITGTNLLAASEVLFGTASATIVTDTIGQIVVTSPPGTPGTVDVTVVGPGGTSATSAADQYTYVLSPIVAGISPTQGPIQGGTTVTITGTNFISGAVVDFGTTAATNVVVVSSTKITAKSPAESAGTVNVTVTTSGGASATSAADDFDFLAVPSVTAVSPTAGPLAGGATVTISGSGFTGATLVDFGTTSASFVIVSDTRITALSPVESAGTVNVKVTGPSGASATSSADDYTYVAIPTVTSISPTSGPAVGGTVVTITGTNLSNATVVDFGTIAATVTVDNATEIVATSPVGFGSVYVTVTTAGGTSSASAADLFTYVPTPAVTAVSPSVGPLQGGDQVTISGTTFTGTTAVYFGSVAATAFTIESATEIIATDPAESVGTVDVTVTTASGTSATSVLDEFTYSLPLATTVSSSLAAGTYIAATQVPITVTFNQAVKVTGTPILSLNAGSGAIAYYTGGTGTSSLTFVYTAAAGQSTSDLDYASTSALQLNGGTIDDLDGNSAVLTLPATGTDGLAAEGIVIAPSSDGFETGNFSALPWQMSSGGPSQADWTVQSSVVQSGNFAAQSGPVGANSSSTLSVTLSGTAGELSFWRKVSSAVGAPGLVFEIDGVPQSEWSGSVGWQQSFYYVSAGEHTYSWIYATGSIAPGGANAAYLDNVVFTPGTTLTVDGTGGNDVFGFNASAGAGSIVVALNGELHTFTTSEFSNYVFVGSGLNEYASMAGAGTGVNSATLYANGSGQLTNSTAGFTLMVSGMASMHAIGNAADTAQLYDSTAADTFYSYADYDGTDTQLSGMLGSSYSNSAAGFGTNIGYSTNGAGIAGFFDSPGNDTYYAYADYNNSGTQLAGMFGTGYSNSAKGFLTNAGYSTNGGSDTASFFDSPGNDTFYSYADYNGTGKQLSGMLGSYGGGYSNSASGFATNKGYSTNGGSDTAVFFDSTGNDVFSAYGNYNGTGKQYATMTGTGYANSATGFATDQGESVNGGSDTANLYNTSAADTLYTDLAIAQLYANSGAYGEAVSGFADVNVYGTGGGTNTHDEGPGALEYQLKLIGTWN
jgi:hypothetical protein